MESMATFSLYDEIQISQCPSNLYDLKQTIKQLYELSNTEINNSLISYCKNDEHYYIFEEEQFQKVKSIIESIILKIELSDEDKYLTIDSTVDEKYQVYKLENEETKVSQDEDDEIIDEDYYDYENMPEMDENEVQKEEKKEDESKIKCNICEMNIQGIRYLCGVCKEFNMCENCEKKEGKEHGHPLLKIRNPDLAPISFKCILHN